MRKKLLTCFVSLLSVMLAWAQGPAAFPGFGGIMRGPALKLIAEPTHSDWVYATGEPGLIDVELQIDGKPVKEGTVRYSAGQEKMATDLTGEIVLKKGKGQINLGTMRTPGFLRCNISAEADGGRASTTITLAFSPESIKPTTTQPDDFIAFWDQCKKDLAALPLDLQMELIPERCTDDVNVYHASAANMRNGVRVYGILCVPKAEGKYPALLTVPGAGARNYTGDIKMAQKGFITFEMGIHGIPVNLDPSFYNVFKQGVLNNSAGYTEFNLDNRDEYYYKRVYLGCIRSIDIMCSLPQWDGKHVAVTGGSQGGGLSIVTAGLDPRVSCYVSFFPAMCDLTGYLYGRAGGWPHMFAPDKWSKNLTQIKIETSKYFDSVNFARQISVPGLWSFGYNDTTCPPTTVYSAYNVVPAQKELMIRVETGHNRYAEQITASQQWIMKQFGMEVDEAEPSSTQRTNIKDNVTVNN